MKILIELGYNNDKDFFKIRHIGSQEECESLKQKLDLELKESKIKWEKAREVRNKEYEIRKKLIDFLRLVGSITEWKEFPDLYNKLIEQKNYLENEIQEKIGLFSQEEKELLTLINTGNAPYYTAYVITENGKSYPPMYYSYKEYCDD